MNSQKLIDELSTTIESLISNLKTHQLEDGGFKGYHLFDKGSGIWTTTEILTILLKVNPSFAQKDWAKKGADYLLSHQNDDGGWGFRGKGKSIVDVTSWSCIAISYFENKDAILRAVNFIIKARKNSIGIDEGGWGLTDFEPDRIYSTWIATDCLKHLLYSHEEWFDEIQKKEILEGIKGSFAWILKSKQINGGWGALGDENTTMTSTSLALLNILSKGENPKDHQDALHYLMHHSHNNSWELEREIVVTQEGYELTQEWFTSIYCFRACIYFAELGLCPLDKLHSMYLNLVPLISSGKVRPSPDATTELIWPIPLMIEAFFLFKSFITNKRKEYDDFLYKKEIEEKKRKKDEMEGHLKTLFPYPISEVYSSFSHEIDHHRKFQYLIQLYEVVIKYTAIVSLSYTIASSEKIPELSSLIENRFKKPSLGDWINIIEVVYNHSAKIEQIIHPCTKQDILKRQINYVDPELPRLNLSQVLSEIAALRNTWTGHGAVRSVYEYKQETEKQIPILFSLLNRLLFLGRCNSFLILSSEYNEFGDGDTYKIRVFNGLDIFDNDIEIQKRLAEGQKDQLILYVYFHNTETNIIVNLYPFLSYMFCSECKKQRFFFFNGVKNNSQVSYLSFECGHTVEHNNLNHFSKRFKAVELKFE